MRDKFGRLDDKFITDMKEVQKARIVNGKDNKVVGTKRLSLAIHRHPLFKKIKEDMKKADLPNKKGSFSGILSIMSGITMFIIIGMIVVLILAVWVTNFGVFNDAITTLPSQNNVTNVSEWAVVTFGNLNEAFGQFRWWAIMIIFGLAIGLLMSNFLIKIHPAFFIVYILIVVILIVFSIIISNTYEVLFESSGTLGDSLQTFRGASWMIIYLPVWVTILSVLGGILLFINIGRDDSQARIA